MKFKHMNFFSVYRLLILFSAIFVATITNAQNREFTISKTELNESGKKKAYTSRVGIDSSGAYFFETWRSKKLKWSAYSSEERSVELIKRSFTDQEIYRHDFTDQLGEKSFYKFYEAGNDLYMIATTYSIKPIVFTIYIAKINKSTGDIEKGFIELGSMSVKNVTTSLGLELYDIPNTKTICVKLNGCCNSIDQFAFVFIERNLENKEKIELKLPANPELTRVQNVSVTKNKDLLFVTKEFAYDAKDPKKQKLVISRNVFYTWEYATRKIKTIYPDDSLLVVGKVVLIERENGNPLLGGTYYTNKSMDDLAGFFFSELNVPDGKIKLISKKDYDFSGISGYAFTENTDKSYFKDGGDYEWYRGKDIVEHFSKGSPGAVDICSVIRNPSDGSIVMFTESYKEYNVYPQLSNSNSSGYTYGIHGDIVAVKADAEGRINNFSQIHMAQAEFYPWRSSSFEGGPSNLILSTRGMGFGSFFACFHNNKVLTFFNDHKLNSENTETKTPVRATCNYMLANSFYCVEINFEKNTLNRTKVYENIRKECNLTHLSNKSGDRILITIANLAIDKMKYVTLKLN